mgnify:FL=1
MGKIRIVKKNDEYNPEYGIGDVFEIEGTWYGGVHILGKTGIPVSLDREEYVELASETKEEEANKKGVPLAETEGERESVSKEEGKFSQLDENRSKIEYEKTQSRDIRAGDIVRHFKREWAAPETTEYLYKVLGIAVHTETEEKLVVYQALYAPFKIFARPYDMFMGKVDREKYPEIGQKYRFEKVEEEEAQ